MPINIIVLNNRFPNEVQNKYAHMVPPNTQELFTQSHQRLIVATPVRKREGPHGEEGAEFQSLFYSAPV